MGPSIEEKFFILGRDSLFHVENWSGQVWFIFTFYKTSLYIIWTIRNRGDFLYKGSYDWGEVCLPAKILFDPSIWFTFTFSKTCNKKYWNGRVFLYKGSYNCGVVGMLAKNVPIFLISSQPHFQQINATSAVTHSI